MQASSRDLLPPMRRGHPFIDTKPPQSTYPKWRWIFILHQLMNPFQISTIFHWVALLPILGVPLLQWWAKVISTITGLLTICQAELAAMLVFNNSTPIVTFTNKILYPWVFPLGFMSSLSLLHLPLFALNVVWLHTLNDKYITSLIVVVSIVQGRSKHLLHEVSIPFDQYKLSIHETEDEDIVFDGGNSENKPIHLLMELLGIASLSQICMLKTKQTLIVVRCVLGWIIPCHSFGCHVPRHYL